MCPDHCNRKRGSQRMGLPRFRFLTVGSGYYVGTKNSMTWHYPATTTPQKHWVFVALRCYALHYLGSSPSGAATYLVFFSPNLDFLQALTNDWFLNALTSKVFSRRRILGAMPLFKMGWSLPIAVLKGILYCLDGPALEQSMDASGGAEVSIKNRRGSLW